MVETPQQTNNHLIQVNWWLAKIQVLVLNLDSRLFHIRIHGAIFSYMKTMKINQMQVNMPCMDAIGYICKLKCKHNFVSTVICCGMLPVPPQESLCWKSKWNKGGTAAATGYPTTQSSPAAVQPNSVPVMILEGDAMEVGRPKRSLDAEGEMHDWDLIHAEVLSQLTMEELGCRITYPNLLWPAIDYSQTNPAIKIPPQARGSMPQWGKTSVDGLPKLVEVPSGSQWVVTFYSYLWKQTPLLNLHGIHLWTSVFGAQTLHTYLIYVSISNLSKVFSNP